MLKKNKKIILDEKVDKNRKHIPLYKYSKGGKISSVIALINIFLMILTISISIVKKGNAGIYVGIIMLMILVMAAVGFVVGINSFQEGNKFMRYTYIGTISNAAIWIGILGIYLIYV